jgi:hypothetical protein
MATSQNIRTLKLSLLADTSQFGAPLRGAQTDFQKFEQGLSEAAGPAAAALSAITVAAASAINAASDLSQTFGAVEQIFGERAARRLDEFARSAADSLGQSRQEALGAAQQFGILGRTAGLEGEALADFSIQLATLASDLAAFGNSSPQEAIEALGSALRGEFNPIERYGVVLNAAAVQQTALNAGLAESATEITAADQVYARFLAIVEQTTIQQGQFARESESLSAQAAIAKANIENFRIEVGEELLPVVSNLLPKMRGFVDTLVSADPEKVITFAGAIGILTGSIVALNTAVKVAASLKAAYGLLGLAGTGVGAGVVGAGAIGYKVGQVVEQSGIDQLLPEDSILGRGQGSPFRPQAGVSQPRIPRTGGLSAQTVINVSGFVGNERELVRAIERAQEQARRSGSIADPRNMR